MNDSRKGPQRIVIQRKPPTPEDEERYKRQAVRTEVIAGFVYLAILLPLLGWLRFETSLIDRFIPLHKVFAHPNAVAYCMAFAAMLIYVVRKRVPYFFGYVEVLTGTILISAAAQKAAEAADHITDVFILSAISGIFLCVRGCEKIHEHAANAKIQIVTTEQLRQLSPQLYETIMRRGEPDSNK